MTTPVKMSGEIRLDLVLSDGRAAGAAIRFDESETVDVADACARLRRWATEVEAYAKFSHATGLMHATVDGESA